jgi:hypothetical protein
VENEPTKENATKSPNARWSMRDYNIVSENDFTALICRVAAAPVGRAPMSGEIAQRNLIGEEFILTF